MVRLSAHLLIWGYKNRTKESPSVCSGGLFLWEAYVLGNALGFSEGTTFWGGIAKKAAHFFWQAIFLSCFFGAKKQRASTDTAESVFDLVIWQDFCQMTCDKSDFQLW